METMFLTSDTLIQAADVLRSAARRIEAVCRPLEYPDEDLKEFRGLKAKTDLLLDSYTSLRDMLQQAVSCILSDWEHIENNRARLDQVRRFLERYDRFCDTCIHFDVLCLTHMERAAAIFGDYQPAVEYQLLLFSIDDQLHFVRSSISNAYQKLRLENQKYYRMSVALSGYISGLTDAQLEDIIERHEYPLLKAHWIGPQTNTATFFGHHFGLTCQEMNTIFHFYSEDGRRTIKLHYARYHDRNIKPTDAIAKILSHFPPPERHIAEQSAKKHVGS